MTVTDEYVREANKERMAVDTARAHPAQRVRSPPHLGRNDVACDAAVLQSI
ncbi:hypothetical protein [Mesorhizobium sp. LjRoot246]|uniref:hypothetical protein n=1 Tax=Mesorhizobium sp. LjRoot246 TaxID=3342294 RepID=UPI003ECE3C0C